MVDFLPSSGGPLLALIIDGAFGTISFGGSTLTLVKPAGLRVFTLTIGICGNLPTVGTVLGILAASLGLDAQLHFGLARGNGLAQILFILPD